MLVVELVDVNNPRLRVLADRLGSWLNMYYWVRDNIRYKPQGLYHDTWKSPQETLEQREGDCEDLALLLLTLLRIRGYNAWARIARIQRLKDNKILYHVYVVIKRDDEWLILDPSCKNCEPGDKGFIELQKIMDFNEKIIIVYSPRLAERWIIR